MKNYQAKDVAAFIASADQAARPKLKELRKLIMATVPQAAESISWGVPFYKYQGVLAGFAPFKNHVTFGLVTVLENGDRQTLAKKGYATGKKTVQIGFDQKMPTVMIKKILKQRVKANETKKVAKASN